MRTSRIQVGFTLIELMVALLLASLILAGVVLLFQQSKSSALQDEQVARMQENGRFALRLVGREISMMGYFGGMLNLSPGSQLVTTEVNTQIACDTSTNNDWGAALVHDNDSDDMQPNSAAINDISLNFYNNATTSDYACIANSQLIPSSSNPNPDIVAIKRVSDSPNFQWNGAGTQVSTVNSVTAGNIYFKTDLSYAGLYIADGSTDNGNATLPNVVNQVATVRQYMPEIFFIRPYSVTAGDGIPALVRETLVGTAMQAQPLVDGIENMQIEWGIAGSGTTPSYYVANPTATELGKAVTARIYLLVRSINPVVGYKNDKTYVLGSTSVGPFNDAYYRRVYTTTVEMRNAPVVKNTAI